MSGEASYAQMAYDALHAIHADPGPDNRLPEDGYGLSRATVGLGFAISYDLCYQGWSSSQRSYIRGKIVTALNAWEAFSHPNLGSPLSSNWIGVCHGGELLLMLAAEEHLSRPQRFAFLKDRLEGHLETFGSKGWNQEGNHYMPYSSRFVLKCAVALQNICDTAPMR